MKSVAGLKGAAKRAANEAEHNGGGYKDGSGGE
jgi:hypothetical protein